MLHRRKAPAIPPFPSLSLPNLREITLENGFSLTIAEAGHHPIIILDISFDAGAWYAPKAGIARLTARMLLRSFCVKDLSLEAYMERFGARISTHAGTDKLYIRIATPARHFRELLPALQRVLVAPTFLPSEWDTMTKIVRQEIRQAKANPHTWALDRLSEQVFGPNHPYGYVLSEAQLDAIELQDSLDHYQAGAWRSTNMLISGAITEPDIEALKEAFSHLTPTAAISPTYNLAPGEALLELPGSEHSVQSVIAIGHPTIPMTHPDHPHLYIANILLGGFFGSCLMRTIREKKGYTYGIHSTILPYRHHGYWYLTTQVNKAFTEDVLRAINQEIHRLQHTPIATTHLTSLKQYLSGLLLDTFDDLLNLQRPLQLTKLHKLPLSYYSDLYDKLQEITPDTIVTIAKKYFSPDALRRVIVG